MIAARPECPCCLSTFLAREGGPFPSLRAYMLRNQANFVDLSQGEFALAPDMYIPGDGHLNDKGHRQVAAAIQRWLQLTTPIQAQRTKS